MFSSDQWYIVSLKVFWKYLCMELRKNQSARSWCLPVPYVEAWTCLDAWICSQDDASKLSKDMAWCSALAFMLGYLLPLALILSVKQGSFLDILCISLSISAFISCLMSYIPKGITDGRYCCSPGRFIGHSVFIRWQTFAFCWPSHSTFSPLCDWPCLWGSPCILSSSLTPVSWLSCMLSFLCLADKWHKMYPLPAECLCTAVSGIPQRQLHTGHKTEAGRKGSQPYGGEHWEGTGRV